MSCYAVLDLEMCRIPRTCTETSLSHEIIQIGAVLLNDNYETVDTFMTHVHPQYGTIDPFIEKLTGITKEDVANAPAITEALTLFLQWLPEDAVIVSWSDSDRYQMMDEIDLKELGFPEFDPYFDEWIDCQYTFGEKMDSDRQYKLSEALNITAIPYDEGEHDALVDAKNTALLFAKMEKEPELQLSPYLIR